MIETPPPCNTTGAPNNPGATGPSLIDPQATFNVYAMVILSATMLVTPFIRLGVGCRYFVGVPTVGAFIGLMFVAGYARMNLDRGLFLLFIYVWVSWMPIRILYAALRRYQSPVHSQYNGWPFLCALFRIRGEGFVKLLVEPGICIALSLPWSHRAPVFSGLLFFVGICLFAAHALSNHLVNRRAQALLDAEIEQRGAIAAFREMRGGR